MAKRHLPLLLLLGFNPAQASTVLGSPDCLEFHSAHADPERKLEAAAYDAWLLELNDDKPGTLTREADDFCRQNPDRKLHEAALRQFERRLNERVDELSDQPGQAR